MIAARVTSIDAPLPGGSPQSESEDQSCWGRMGDQTNTSEANSLPRLPSGLIFGPSPASKSGSTIKVALFSYRAPRNINSRIGNSRLIRNSCRADS